MIYEIEPYTGIGPIRLGMSREEIHTLIVDEREPTRRGSEQPGDFFPTLGLFVDYRAPGICAFVEVARYGPISPMFQGQELLRQPYHLIRAWFATGDPDFEMDESGPSSRRFGIAFYAGLAEEELDESAEGVAIFEKGYYDPERMAQLAMDEKPFDPSVTSKSSSVPEGGATQLTLFDGF